MQNSQLEVIYQRMYQRVETKDPIAVQAQAQSVYLTLFPAGDPLFVPRAFGWAVDCFNGNYRDYLPIDARYHDFEHTLQGALCLVRILRGQFLAGAAPAPDQRMFELALLAILLHDTGYLKRQGDAEGTGAKYTLIHVTRSAEFAETILREKGYASHEIAAVQNMIRCTGVNVNLAAIPFAGEIERHLGYVLGTADLLGQMAADDYIDKLPILYLEFAESARHNDGKMTAGGAFSSAEDLMRRTPLFWEKYVKPKIEKDFLGLYRYLSVPYPDGPNFYLQQIEANIERLRGRMATAKAA